MLNTDMSSNKDLEMIVGIVKATFIGESWNYVA